jgi:hypothetical protein
VYGPDLRLCLGKTGHGVLSTTLYTASPLFLGKDWKKMSEQPGYQYYEGFFRFYHGEVEVLMDEETFEEYMHAYLVKHGMETRSEEELLEAATKAQQQRKEVETILMNPDYWLALAADSRIRIIRREHQERNDRHE